MIDIRDAANPRAVALAVAGGLRAAPGSPTGLPFRITEPPKQPLAQVRMRHETDDQYAVLLDYGDLQLEAYTSDVGYAGLREDERIGPWSVESEPSEGGKHVIRFGSSDTSMIRVVGPRAAAWGITEGFEMTGEMSDPATWKS